MLVGAADTITAVEEEEGVAVGLGVAVGVGVGVGVAEVVNALYVYLFTRHELFTFE
jgi:hypothetical protein